MEEGSQVFRSVCEGRSGQGVCIYSIESANVKKFGVERFGCTTQGWKKR